MGDSMPAFSSVVTAATLNGTDGFQLVAPVPQDKTGWSVASAGDLNNDGYDDFLIGARESAAGGDQRGTVYVVFGRSGATPFDATTALSSLSGSQGFAINGVSNYQNLGTALSGVGDINNDGFDDFILGTTGRDPAAFVIFGSASLTSVDLTALNGANGFAITGTPQYSYAGSAVSGAGDFNGDGFADLIIGARNDGFDGYSPPAGGAYVIFGKAGGFSANLDLSDSSILHFTADTGGGDSLGYSVSDAGDVNGDGYDDLIVGASQTQGNTGGAYLVFGRAGALTGLQTINTLSDTVFLTPLGTSREMGRAVSSAGDIKGDGFDDVMIASNYGTGAASNSGLTYIVFGKASGWSSSLDLVTMSASEGFRILGAASEDKTGVAVSNIGDVNGDSIDDLIVGGNQVGNVGQGAGAAYVIFGRTGGFTDINVSTLDGSNGFRIDGAAAWSTAGRSVSGGGDINGDGVNDIIVGAPVFFGNSSPLGAAYVIYGRFETVTFVGGNGDESQIGGAGGDNLSGGGGKDTLDGGGGADILDGGDGNDVLYGGAGGDSLLGGAGGDIMNGDAGDDSISGGIGADKLFGGEGSATLEGGAGNDRFDGGAGNDILLGGEGNDYFDGGVGADSMTGGVGNDVFIVDNVGDTVTEAAGEGYDIIRSSVSISLLAANIEACELQGSADLNATGNGDANNLQGNTGANQLNGGGGVDTINGNDGDDVIIGGTGNDLLRGGLGADSFRVLGESMRRPILENDQIFDFSTAEGDILDLSAIDANSLLAGEQAFSLVSVFSKQAGQMTMSFSGGVTLIRLDVNGDTKADYQLKINGDVTGDSAGWML